MRHIIVFGLAAAGLLAWTGAALLPKPALLRRMASYGLLILTPIFIFLAQASAWLWYRSLTLTYEAADLVGEVAYLVGEWARAEARRRLINVSFGHGLVVVAPPRVEIKWEWLDWIGLVVLILVIAGLRSGESPLKLLREVRQVISAARGSGKRA